MRRRLTGAAGPRRYPARARTLRPARAAAALLALGGLAVTTACAFRPHPAPAAVASSNASQVCGTIIAAVAGDLTAFGTDVGALAGHQSGRNSSAAAKARTAALGRLTTLAGKIRAAGQSASEPAVAMAASTAAANLEQLAADPSLLAGVHAAADVPPVIVRVTSAADPLVNACA
jgi:hypothetical protein